MKYFKLLGTLAIIAIASNLQAQSMGDDYYYGTDSPVTLTIDSQSVMIKFASGISQTALSDFLESFPRISIPGPNSDTMDGLIRVDLSVTSGYWSFIDSLNSSANVLMAAPMYRFTDGASAPIGQRITVRFNDDVSYDSILIVAQSFGLTIVNELPFMPHVYVLRNSGGASDFTLDVSNQLHEHTSTVYSHPTLGIYPQRTEYKAFDYFATYQPHIKRVVGDFNSRSVWDFAGLTRTVTVAVIDDGVAVHEDLPQGKLVQGKDFYAQVNFPGSQDADPVPGPMEAHGQACAGLIGSLHTTDSMQGLSTTSGLVSLSPRARIMPVKIFSEQGQELDHNSLASAISFAYQHGAEVISNSWTFGSPFRDVPVVNDALQRAVYFGRNGLGCPVIFSSGNSFSSLCDYPANQPYVFAVGASHYSDDTRWDYSSYGPELDVMAPSGRQALEPVWGLDQMGSLGYNPTAMSDCPPQSNNQNYDCHFGGTSAACPIVAGIASLLLAKDSTLSAQAVYYILRESADTSLAWGTFAPPNNQYGYGVVNAFNAILSISRGDLTNDNSIDLSDLSLLIAYMVLTPRPTIFPSSMLADLNCSGSVDLSDLTWMIEFVSSIPGTFPEPVSPCFAF